MLNCKVDETQNLNAQASKVQQQPKKGKVQYDIGTWSDRDLPSACSLIGKKYLGSLFQVDPNDISVKDGNPYGKESRSCFFRWDTKDLPNAGVLLMVSKNPQPDKVDNWASLTISSKISNGDAGMEGESAVRYKPFTELGNTGAYSHEMAKYYWQVNDELLYMIAFNMNSHPDQQKAVAIMIGERIMQNFVKKTKQ